MGSHHHNVITPRSVKEDTMNSVRQKSHRIIEMINEVDVEDSPEKENDNKEEEQQQQLARDLHLKKLKEEEEIENQRLK